MTPTIPPAAASAKPPKREPDAPPAWSTRVREAVQHLYVVVTVQLLWLGLTLLGLVIAGIAPASTAAASALTEFRRDERVRVAPVMWEVYRREFLGSTLRMAPLLIVQIVSVAMLWQALVGLMSRPALTAGIATLAGLSIAWATVSLAAIAVAPRVRDQKVLVTWRLALLIPGALPLRSLALVMLLAAWTVIASFAWPLALLLGAGVAIDLAVGLFTARIALLLEDLGGRRTDAG